jgi:type 1 fimbria pilin
MNVPYALGAITTAMMLTATAVPAAAQSRATANFSLTGQIEAGSCAITAVTRTMKTIPASDFPNVAATAGGAAASFDTFDLGLTGCSGVTGATITFGVAADAADGQADAFKNKAATNPAPHTGLLLKETNCTTGATVTPGKTLTRTFATATHNVPLCAQYYKLAGGLVTKGAISTNFTLTVTFL